MAITVCLGGWSQSPTGNGTAYFTLEDCLHYALGNNYTRKNMLLSEDMQDEAYKQSKKERLPSVSASLSESYAYSNKTESGDFSGNYGINASLPIYEGGTISNTIEQNKLTVEKTKLQTEQYENELTIKVLQAFLSVLGNEELLKYQEVVVASSKAQLEQGRVQYEVGDILESDYLLLESQYAGDKASIVDTEIARDNGILSLKNILSMDPEVDLQIMYPDTSSVTRMLSIPTQAYAVEQAMITLPDLKIDEYDIDLANLDLKIARAGYLPSLSLSAGVSSGHTDGFSSWGTKVSDNFGANVGLSLSIPIYDKGKTKSAVNQRKLALQQAEYSRSQSELNLKQTIIQGYQDVVSAKNRYQSNQVKEDAYKRTFDAYRAMFEEGAITPVELLQQQNNYISALNDYIQSKYSFILYRKMLDVYMGEDIIM